MGRVEKGYISVTIRNETLKHTPIERARKTMWGGRSGSPPIGLDAEKQRGEFWIFKGENP